MCKKTIGMSLLFCGIGIIIGHFLGFSAFIIGSGMIGMGMYFLNSRY